MRIADYHLDENPALIRAYPIFETGPSIFKEVSAMATGEWGGYEPAGKGKWRIRYSADTGDGRGYRRRSETFRGTERAVKRRLAELQTLYDTGAAHRRVPTFDELWERDVWPRIERTCAPNTARSYGYMWKRVHERWGAVRLDAYNGAQVQDWLAGLTRRTGRECLGLMRRVSNRAFLLGLAPRDPLAADLALGEARPEPERTELRLGPYLRAAADESPLLLAGVLLMAAGGCRPGEALAVRADSVRWDENAGRATFEVADEALNDSPALAGRLKNGQSARTASMPGEAGRVVAAVAAQALGEGLAFVVDSGTGTPVCVATFRRRWHKACEAAGLERVTLRSLRRSFATLSLDAGADAGDVNLSMGHTRDSRTLYSHYDRPDRSCAPELPEALSLGGILPQNGTIWDTNE